ncbi:GNAT family N-acetyltransferase [Myxococcota bacterium]|nr:GNAT family N-acetyltransferase [Myxococcota bacterium]
MLVRRAKPGDLPALLAMMDDFNCHEAITTSRARIERALTHLLAHDELGLVLLFEHDGDVAGYSVLTYGYDLEFSGRDAFMTELYLTPSARGRGLGQRALAAVEDAAKAHGVHAIHLVVRTDNDVALHVYEKGGFVRPPRVLMSKNLVTLEEP